MKARPNQRLLRQVPSFAKGTIGAAIRGESPQIEGEKKPLSRQSVYGATRRAVQEHARLVREDDNPVLDEDASDEPGRVKYRSLDFHYSGSPKNGEVLANRGGNLTHTRIREDKIEITEHSPNGRSEIRVLDLENPEESYSIEQVGEKDPNAEPRPLPTGESWPAKAVSPGVMSLGQALESAGGDLKAIYLDGDVSQAEYRLAKMNTLEAEMAKLPEDLGAKMQKAMQAKRPSLPHEIYQLSRDAIARADDATQSQLKKIGSLAGDWAAVESVPGNSADGVTKKADYYVAPQALTMMTAARDWEFDKKSGLPIADSVVVGAGPGGLASAYHLSEAGQHTVVFESGAAGQAFSDKHAKSVHFLRTSEASSNLINTDDVRHFNHEASLQRQRFQIEAHTDEAQAEWVEKTGESFHGRDEDTGISGGQAFPRAGLYDHMQRLAHGLSEKYPDTYLIERSPVSKLEETDNGLFKVTTAKGHQVLAKTLVMATGFVGSDGQNARVLSQIQQASNATPEKTLFLGNDHDEMRQAEGLLDSQKSLEQGRVDKVLMFADRKLGSPDIRNQLSLLPEGSRVALVGGGESGAKAALEMLSLNPGISIDFYTSRELEPYQTQVPAGHLNTSAVKNFHQHAELAEQSLDQLKDFGAPVTPDTLKGIFSAVKEGRIELLNLGERFSPSSVKTQVSEDEVGAGLDITVTSEKALDSLARERTELAELGFSPDSKPTKTRRARMLVSAIGYHTERSKPSALAQQLIDQNLLDIESGETDPRIFVNTAGLATDTADTALVGRAVKGWETPHRLARFLPERPIPESKMDTQANWFGRVVERRPTTNTWMSYEDVNDNLEAGATDFGVLRFSEESVQDLDQSEASDIQLQFQIRRHQYAAHSPMGAIDFMAENFPNALSPEEKLLHRRSENLLSRTSTVEERIRAAADKSSS